ncbi:MAG TPA: hypothetical protein VLW17_00900, partial [Thermoanaerobaculaceae bacterium]|nr:hypothetical protein [Thermoanaerobaculaceae bacterium]
MDDGKDRLAARPGTWAIRPESNPCELREMLHTAPIAPTSMADGGTLISLHTPTTAFLMMSGTLIPMSLPNFDWW